jgi:hypothetical protein
MKRRRADEHANERSVLFGGFGTVETASEREHRTIKPGAEADIESA